MWKFLNNFKTKIGLVIAVIIALSQVPMTRDMACNLVGIALASEQKKIEKKLDSTNQIMKEMIMFQRLILESIMRDTLLEKGVDSITIDTFLKLQDQRWDSLLKRMNGDSL